VVVLIPASSADPFSEKNSENWSTFADVIVKIKVTYFFLRHGV